MGQHRNLTTRSTPQIPTRPPAHSPLSIGELRGYNTPCGMLVNPVHDMETARLGFIKQEWTGRHWKKKEKGTVEEGTGFDKSPLFSPANYLINCKFKNLLKKLRKKFAMLTRVVDVRDKHVLVVEEIVDSGRTLDFNKKRLEQSGSKSVKVVALLDKKERREVDLVPDFVGAVVANYFLVGYGLDWGEKYRYLDSIYQVVDEKLR